MKEIKDTQIKVRITKSEREKIEQYCQDAELTICQLLRLALQEYMGAALRTQSN